MKISNLCTRVDLELVQGATFGPVKHTLKNPDGTPVDLAGATLRGQVRRKASDPVVAASFVFTNAAPATGSYTSIRFADLSIRWRPFRLFPRRWLRI